MIIIMNYYRGNALYAFIKEKGLNYFKFFSGDIWQLIYGNSKSDPILLVLAVGLSNSSKPVVLSPEIIDAWGYLKLLSEKSNIPLILVQFSIDKLEIEFVHVSLDLKAFEKKTMIELTTVFHNYGLPTSNTPTQKAKNDRTSSAYHDWQRTSLGRDLVISDIDLWKLDKSGNVNTIFELKRSKIPIERWQPYPDDYKNFELLLKICKLTGIEFKISYNYMGPSGPRIEDISKIKLFKLEFVNNKMQIIEQGIFPLNDFVKPDFRK